MIQIVEAVFDGTTLHPTAPLDLEAGTRVRITVESVLPERGILEALTADDHFNQAGLRALLTT